jgi:arylsulfatase
VLGLALGSGTQAGDAGSRHHAGGHYDAATATYAVVAGDDLATIAERFGTTVAALKAANRLSSDTIDIGQRLVVAAGTSGDAATGAPPSAVQVTGVMGSPGATTTISGEQLPPPAPAFGGVIKNDALQSTPWWAPRVVPPKGAPNVLLIMTDDAGFGVPSTFGGVIPTPTMDSIADAGLRYNRMFSTSLCSPTRAALITGRNHHSVGFGVIAEQATGFPGYDSVIAWTTRPSAASCGTTATRPAGSARTTTRRPIRPARSGPLPSGPRVWVSTISTALSAAMPTNGGRTSSAIRRRSTPGSATRVP